MNFSCISLENCSVWSFLRWRWYYRSDNLVKCSHSRIVTFQSFSTRNRNELKSGFFWRSARKARFNWHPFYGTDWFLFVFQKGPHDAKYGLIIPPSKHFLKVSIIENVNEFREFLTRIVWPQVLVVFQYADPVGEIVAKAAEKLNFETNICTSDSNALEEYQAKSHDLVIVDTRSTKSIDYETLCRWVETAERE